MFSWNMQHTESAVRLGYSPLRFGGVALTFAFSPHPVVAAPHALFSSLTDASGVHIHIYISPRFLPEMKKWLGRLISRKQKTPIPPKPYVDTASTAKHMSNPRFYDLTDLRHVDPEKPHWQDSRFDSREKVPFFDLFGFNRDWSWSIYKMMTFIFVLVMYHEGRTLMYDSADNYRTSKATTISPEPHYSRNEEGTAEELRKAGFAYVGVKELDHLGIVTKKL